MTWATTGPTTQANWLTYDQFAASRRITRRAAVRMTQRHHLRRQPGNDGLIRVWVPHDMAKPSQRVTLPDDLGAEGSNNAGGDWLTSIGAPSGLRRSLDHEGQIGSARWPQSKRRSEDARVVGHRLRPTGILGERGGGDLQPCRQPVHEDIAIGSSICARAMPGWRSNANCTAEPRRLVHRAVPPQGPGRIL
jgi:hypothetical protein